MALYAKKNLSLTPIHLTTTMTTTTTTTNNKSPITAEKVALAGVSFSELRSNGKEVFFCARDPANSGKTAIQSISTPSNISNISTMTTLRNHTTPESNARSAVHEYGGGAFCILNDGSVLYTDFPTHLLYQSSLSDQTPQNVPLQNKHCRFADFSTVSQTRVVCVMEDHTNPAPANVTNSIVLIHLDSGTVQTLASGHDFYTCPQVNKDATQLAYIAWDHPNMPWDHTLLYVQHLKDGTPDGNPIIIDQGSPCSMCEPRWANNRLVFLSDLTGWYNLYQFHHETITPLYPKQADFCSSSQGWNLGLSPYIILNDGSIVACYTPSNNYDGVILVSIPPSQNCGTPQEFGRAHIPPTSVSSLCATDSYIYFVGGSTTNPPAIWCWDRSGVAQQVLSSINISIDLTELQAAMSEPQFISFPSTGGVGHAYGYFYAPTNNSMDTNLKPPLLVKAHGGPTSQTSTTFRLVIQFWTSRGFAVLDVDYGGSTGYGKEFRQSLQGQWGVVDVNDVCAGAKYCVKQGWVNPEWLCIDGSSAGGYTTLAALTFCNTFSAGASLYGVSDLSALAEDTHKFESRYLDGLIGKYPRDKAIFDERCPILFTDKLNCPILLLQGTEDKIVPPNQAEQMFEALQKKGLPTSLILYKDEQHGFRKKENIQHALTAEYSFFCQVFGIEPEEGTEPITIGERMQH